jgi:eukaryotic-like serine/threonine-protein kinase
MPLAAVASSGGRCSEVSLRAALVCDESSERSACLTEDQVLAFSEGKLSHAAQREVDLHLDVCSACHELVIGVATRWRRPRPPSDESVWNTSLLPGELVASRYHIEHFIAHGGMGEIYRAHELALGRAVALKTLLVTTSIRDGAHPLAREAELGQRVCHPNVCRTHGYGVHRARRRAPLHFLTMELLDGPRLGQLLRRRRLELPEALRLGRQVLSGLAAIHQAGVLHLDLKSDNIVLRAAQTHQEAVIIDFGLSRAAGAPLPDSTQPLAGTLAYMAPEQALAVQPSAHSDVFSFGVVLFEMLTGHLPFQVAEKSPGAELVRRMLEPAPKPSELARDIPPALDAFIARCLAGTRRGRFRDGGEALRGLESFAGDPFASAG